MKEATAKDTQLTKVIQTIKDGWPDNKHSLPKGVEEFWNFRSELSVLDGLLFRGEKLVVPKALRQEMLTRIHTGHLGIEKCKRRARDVLFWPRMNAQIEDVVLGCSICSENAIANQKEPLINRKIPFRPWEVVATDLFTVNGLDYLLVVDFYSRYPEIEKLKNTSSSTVISKLKSIFARHGIPAEVVSDNGPQYTSKEFTKFATDWDFKHNTSSPRYPQSNGLAEKYVQITKRLIEKARKDGRDPFLSLLEYRNTPIDKEASPAQLLMSRRLRSVLPITYSQLHPMVQDPARVKEEREYKQSQQKRQYDKTARILPTLTAGDNVWMRDLNGRWKPAVVVRKDKSPRSYTLRSKDGQQYRRNRRHIRKTKGNAPFEIDVPDNVTETPKSAQGMPANVTTDEGFYVTRSGRRVKPREILNL